MVGQAFAIHQRLSGAQNFWFGHQGFEYVDLGRFWQILLFVGLLLWLTLMLRSLLPAIRSERGVGSATADSLHAVGRRHCTLLLWCGF